MKWAFFILVTLNVVVISAQWVGQREKARVPVYIDEGADIELLGEHTGDIVLGGHCGLLGPLSVKRDAEDLMARIEFIEQRVEMIVKDKLLAPGYWVYLNVGKDESSHDRLIELEVKNIDSFLIPAGPLKGNISLGIFDNIDSARRMLKSMVSVSIDAKLREIEKSKKEYWLQLTADYAAENKDKFDSLMRSEKNKHGIRQILCKSVASEKQFP